MISKIKLVHIISNLSQGGAQLLLFDILKNLGSKNDLEIFVITLDSGEYVEKFESNGIRVIDLKLKGLINVKIYYKLKRILNELKPDIVHTHLHKADFYGRIVAKQLGVPVIVSTCHNYSTNHKYADINRKSYFDRIDNLVVNYSDSYLIAISGLVKEYVTGRDKTFLNRTEVIYNGVDITKEKYLLSDKSAIMEFRNKWGFNTDDFVISIIGRLEDQKGHLFFLRSMKDILKENKKIKILIVGDGSLRNEIENYISENNLGTSVITTGFIPDSQKYIEISDLIAVPSLWEGFGLVIIEGMIKNKIILASDTGGIPEIIEDDRTGFLFALNNKKNFLDKFNYIYNNLNKLDEIKKNSLELVKEKFDIQKNSELYYQYYINKLSIINSNPTK